MPAEHSRSVRSTWWYTLGSLVFFIGFYAGFIALLMLEALGREHDPLISVAVALQLLAGAMQVRYSWFLRAGRAGGLPGVRWTIALVAPGAALWALGLGVPGIQVLAAASLWSASSLIAALVPRSVRWPLLGVSAMLFLAQPLIASLVFGMPNPYTESSGAWVTTGYAVALPLMLLSSLWWWEIVVELDRGRRSAAELAVIQERLRFASDLHDIQGHHLQVISLKAELAERLLAIDPDAARDHLHETRLIAKQALEETRSLVAGYRRVALEDELENAREVLAAAGADCEWRIGDRPEDPLTRSALGSVVREATTNILRHSDATNVSITLSTEAGRSVLVVANDGVTGSPSWSGAPPDIGSGLTGLRERLAGVGGTLSATTDALEDRFELRAEVPATVTVST